MSTNDNQRAATSATGPADPHGIAALVLVESLIHGLCESATLTGNQAVDIAARAVDVQREAAETTAESAAAAWLAHRLLAAIATSLAVDATEDRGPAPIG